MRLDFWPLYTAKNTRLNNRKTCPGIVCSKYCDSDGTSCESGCKGLFDAPTGTPPSQYLECHHTCSNVRLCWANEHNIAQMLMHRLPNLKRRRECDALIVHVFLMTNMTQLCGLLRTACNLQTDTCPRSNTRTCSPKMLRMCVVHITCTFVAIHVTNVGNTNLEFRLRLRQTRYPA